MMIGDARWRGVWLGVVVAMLAGMTAVGADTGAIQASDATLRSGDVASLRSTSWQYRDLDALAQAGLLSGHPKGPISDWADRLTRYEAASLVLRAVEGIGKAYQAQGESLVQVAQATPGEAPTAPATVTFEDLARVEKLIEEFRAELVTMGARVDNLATALADVQKRLAKVETEQKQHKLDGYFQIRYQDDEGTDKNDFLVRRARLNVRGPLSDRTAYRIEFQMDAKEAGMGPCSKTQLRTLYLDYKLNRGLLRIGQAKVPWGYELLESVPDLWTAERALFMDRLFPNQRDIGVQWSYRKSPSAPQFDVGIFNGTGINASDNNDRKNLMARVDFPLPSGTVALSTYRGSNGTGTAATRQDRDGVSARLKWAETEFLSEYVQGRDRGYDARGWYAQLGHPISSKAPNLLFAKYDRYDENLDLANDMFERWSLGYWYQLDKSTRLTLVWESRDADPLFTELSKWDGNAYYVQVQTKF